MLLQAFSMCQMICNKLDLVLNLEQFYYDKCLQHLLYNKILVLTNMTRLQLAIYKIVRNPLKHFILAKALSLHVTVIDKMTVIDNTTAPFLNLSGTMDP